MARSKSHKFTPIDHSDLDIGRQRVLEHASAPYDRFPHFRPTELATIRKVLARPVRLSPKVYEKLKRLLDPIRRVTEQTQAGPSRHTVKRFLLKEMLKRKSPYWAWSQDEWFSVFENARPETANKRDLQQHILAVGYLLCGINVCDASSRTPSSIKLVLFAQKVLGKDNVTRSFDQVRQALASIGYSGLSRKAMKVVVADALVRSRSGSLELITIDILLALLENSTHVIPRRLIYRLSRALTILGILPEALTPKKVPTPYDVGGYDVGGNCVPEWKAVCDRWRATSTISPNAKRASYYCIVKVGRWLAEAHPGILRPEDWTTNIAIDYVAAIDKMRIGDYPGSWVRKSRKPNLRNLGKPYTPATKHLAISSLRTFLLDCQDWGWCKLRFNPSRVLVTPRSIRTRLQVNPRVINEAIWAKLMWSAINLSDSDLPSARYRYPVCLLRAIAMIWIFGALRADEIARLEVGCVSRQPMSDTSQDDSPFFLTVPANKTSNSFVKPIDKIAAEALLAWETMRPVQPATVDRITGRKVNALFSIRGRSFSGTPFLNRTLIPLLCRKAGVPAFDARGPITSHRARATMATQLYNAPDAPSLQDLQALLGHKSPQSTLYYTAITPMKLFASMKKADYFRRNMRTIEVLVDRESENEKAAVGLYYDLISGFCSNPYFSTCPHRMACPKCTFYIAKDSSKGQMIESDSKMLRLLDVIELNEQEVAAISGDQAAVSSLIESLKDVSTPDR